MKGKLFDLFVGVCFLVCLWLILFFPYYRQKKGSISGREIEDAKSSTKKEQLNAA